MIDRVRDAILLPAAKVGKPKLESGCSRQAKVHRRAQKTLLGIIMFCAAKGVRVYVFTACSQNSETAACLCTDSAGLTRSLGEPCVQGRQRERESETQRERERDRDRDRHAISFLQKQRCNVMRAGTIVRLTDMFVCAMRTQFFNKLCMPVRHTNDHNFEDRH